MPLKVSTIILGWICLMLYSDFRAHGPISMPISIPTPPIVALTEFFLADAMVKVHPLPVLWYFISSLWLPLCYCMHILSMLLSIAKGISSSSWPVLGKVLTLNVTIYILRFHFSIFCNSLSSVADFSNIEARAPTSTGRAHFFDSLNIYYFLKICKKLLNFYSRGGLSVGYGNLSVAVFILIYRSHPYRLAAIVTWSNHLILAVEP